MEGRSRKPSGTTGGPGGAGESVWETTEVAPGVFEVAGSGAAPAELPAASGPGTSSTAGESGAAAEAGEPGRAGESGAAGEPGTAGGSGAAAEAGGSGRSGRVGRRGCRRGCLWLVVALVVALGLCCVGVAGLVKPAPEPAPAPVVSVGDAGGAVPPAGPRPPAGASPAQPASPPAPLPAPGRVARETVESWWSLELEEGPDECHGTPLHTPPLTRVGGASDRCRGYRYVLEIAGVTGVDGPLHALDGVTATGDWRDGGQIHLQFAGSRYLLVQERAGVWVLADQREARVVLTAEHVSDALMYTD